MEDEPKPRAGAEEEEGEGSAPPGLASSPCSMDLDPSLAPEPESRDDEDGAPGDGAAGR